MRTNQKLNYLFMLYAFLIPLSRAGIIITTILIIISWIVEGDIKTKSKLILSNRFILSILSLFGLIFISVLWVEPQNYHLWFSYMNKFWYFLPLLALYTSIKKEFIDKIIYSFLVGMIISLFFSYGVLLDIVEGRSAVSFFMTNYIMYGIFLSISALYFIILAINHIDNRFKIIYITLSILFVYILFLNEARTGHFSFIIGIFVIGIIYRKQNLKTVISLLIFAILSTTIIYKFNNNFQNRVEAIDDNIEKISNDNLCNSIGGRVVTWQIAYDILQSEPIFGMGTGDHLIYLKDSMDIKLPNCKGMTDRIDYFHSQYIEIFAQNGLVGLFLLLSIFYYLWRVEIKNSNLKYLKYILITLFLAIFLADVPFRKQFAIALFVLISGLILAQNRIEKSE